MPWFTIDDTFAFHAKVVTVGNGAVGLWTRAGAWCAQQLTDGFVPTAVARSLGTAKEARALVDAKLWHVVDDGYAMHDWDHYNATRAEVEERRLAQHESKVRAGRVGGLASAATRRRNAGRKQPSSSRQAEAQADCLETASSRTKQNEAPSHPIPAIGTSLVETPPPPSRNVRATILNGGADGSAENNDIDQLVNDVRARRRRWKTTAIRTAVRRCLADGRPLPAIRQALLAVAEDGETVAPGRVVGDGPWWGSAGEPTRPPKPAHCGDSDCDPATRVVDDGEHPPYRCPDCHPLRETA